MDRFQQVVRQLGVIGAAIVIASAIPPTGVPTVVGGEARMERQTDASMHAQHNLVKKVQQRLTEKRYDPGPVDGIYGSRTKAAVMAYQKDHSLAMDGALSMETLTHLGLR